MTPKQQAQEALVYFNVLWRQAEGVNLELDKFIRSALQAIIDAPDAVDAEELKRETRRFSLEYRGAPHDPGMDFADNDKNLLNAYIDHLASRNLIRSKGE